MNFDLLSFLLGTATGFLLWWGYSSIKKGIPRARSFFVEWSQSQQAKTSTLIEEKIRKNTFHRTQKTHLAHNLFALNDILITPKILPPIKNILNQQNHPPFSPTDRMIPFTPDFPELASALPVSKICILDAISNRANCVLVAPPGSGKSVTLAHLVSQLCENQNPDTWYSNLIPFYFHAHDLSINNLNDQTPLELLTAIMMDANPDIQTNLLQAWIKKTLEKQPFLIVVDGLDETSPVEHDLVTNFLKTLIVSYPDCQIITTASPDYLGILPEIGFAPLGLACWSENDIYRFMTLWKTNWLKLHEKSKEFSDYITALLFRDYDQITPLEWTLKLWAAFTGDLAGPSPVHAIDAYITRSSGKTVPRSALIALAEQFVTYRLSSAPYTQTEKIFSTFRPKTQSDTQMDFLEQPTDEILETKTGKKTREKKIISRARAITQLLNAGMLSEFRDENLAFSNPVFLGYLASFSENVENTLSPSIQWVIDGLTLRFYFIQNKSTTLISRFIDEDTSPLFSNLLSAARALHTPRHHEIWRNQILEKIGMLLTQAELPRTILVKLCSVLLAANDPSIAALFAQLLKSRKPEARITALLAAAAQKTEKMIQPATHLLQDEVEDVRLAATLYLGMLDHPAAKQEINDIISHGEEDQRVIAAEALGTRLQNFDILFDYLESEDLLTRRAAIGGFTKVDPAISTPVLERLMNEDSQWVIRNYAAQWIEALKNPVNPYAPERISPFKESDWLISYAGKMGIGVSPEILPYEVLLHAVEYGEPDEKLAAMDYLTAVNSAEKNALYDRIINNKSEPTRDETTFYMWFQTSSH